MSLTRKQRKQRIRARRRAGSFQKKLRLAEITSMLDGSFTGPSALDALNAREASLLREGMCMIAYRRRTHDKWKVYPFGNGLVACVRERDRMPAHVSAHAFGTHFFFVD